MTVRSASGPGATTRLDDAALSKLRDLDPDGRRGVVARVLIAFESSLARWLKPSQALRRQAMRQARSVAAVRAHLEFPAGR